MIRAPFSLAPLALTVAAVALLAGCEAQPIGGFERPSYAADRASTPYTVYFTPDAPTLAYGEADRLSGYLRSLSLRGDEDVLLEIGNSGSATLDGQRLLTLRRVFARTPARVRVVVPHEQPTPDMVSNTVTVTVRRFDMIVVDCPNNEAQANELTTPLQQIGCANAINRVGMAERTQDLFAPRTLGPAPAGPAVQAVQRYEAGKVKTPSLPSSTSVGG